MPRASTGLCLLLLAATACEGPASRPGTGVDIWVANQRAGEVLVYGDDGLAVPRVTAASLPPERLVDGFEPSSVALHADRLLVTNFASGEVLAFDSTDGTFLELVHGGSDPVRLEEPCAMRVDGDHVWVLGNDSRNVAVLSEGEETREVGHLQPIRAGHALELADGLLYVATSPSERDLGLVQVRDPESGQLLFDFAPWPELEEATHLMVGPGSHLWVTDWFGDRVARYDRTTGEPLGDVIDVGLDGPVAAASGPDGLLWVLDRTSVVAVDPWSGIEQRRIDGSGRFDWARNLLVTERP